MIASVFSRRCGSYRMYLESDSPHQAVMIVCELKWFSHMSNRHNMYTLMQSCDVFHTQHHVCFLWAPFCLGWASVYTMSMTFVLHPLSHYNSITKPCARFLLSLLEHLTIDFPSHFILSIIDVHLNSASHDKLIFPSAITRILRHFFIPFPSSDHFTVICAIDYTTVKCSEAQFQSRQSDSAAPSSHSAPSRSTPSASVPSSSGDVSLGDVMAHLFKVFQKYRLSKFTCHKLFSSKVFQEFVLG